MALRRMGEGRENSMFWWVEDSKDLRASLALASKEMHEVWQWRGKVFLSGEEGTAVYMENLS